MRADKKEVLGKIRSGQKVSEVSQAHAINEMTVRSYLVRDTGSSAAETPKVSRSRRENERDPYLYTSEVWR
jgi:hypothetical protein